MILTPALASLLVLCWLLTVYGVYRFCGRPPRAFLGWVNLELRWAKNRLADLEVRGEQGMLSPEEQGAQRAFENHRDLLLEVCERLGVRPENGLGLATTERKP